MVNSIKNVSGFTLVEVLIAAALMTLIMGIASLSFSTFSGRWTKVQNQFEMKVNNTRKIFLLAESIEGIANYTISSENDSQYYFSGEEFEMTFVTKNPIFERHSQALVKLKIISDDSGIDRLIYYEAPFTDRVLSHVDQKLDFVHETALFEAADIRFNYFGWKSLSAKAAYAEDEGGRPSWSKNYQGAASAMNPLAVNIIWAQNEPIIFPLMTDNGLKISYTREKRQGG